MCPSKSQSGIVRFESDFNKLSSNSVNFDSETIRLFIEKNPEKIADLAMSFMHSCCGQLGANSKERNACWVKALSQMEEHLKMMKR